MSHFTIGVIIPTDQVTQDVLEAALAPFDENLEVPEYQRECWCVSHGVAENYGHEMARKTVGGLDYFKDEYMKLPEDNRPDWMVFSQPYWEAYEEYKTNHALYLKPYPDCPDCQGTGQEPSTRNPQAKWDWWQVGGRWHGYLGNMEDCILVSELLAQNMPYIPFTLITPDGVWYEKGKMGWFGISYAEKKGDLWPREALALLQKYTEGHSIVLVDAHI